MNKNMVLTRALISVLMLSTLLGVQFVKLAEANFFPIPIPQPAFVIRSDGSVDPSTAPIQRVGNVYTLTDNIVGYTIAIERDNVILDGGGYTLQGNGNSIGLFIKNRNGVTVRNMKISDFHYGIWLFAEIYLSGTSASNTLSGNTLTNNDYGIYISSSSHNVLRNNRMENNTYNFYVTGEFSNDIDDSNTVDGKPIYYWVNEHNKTVPSDAGYVALVDCTDITVQNLNLANNGQGILLVSTTNSVITKNHIANTDTGIYIQDSTNNIIAENNIANNSYGIKGDTSSNNRISSNNITKNENGIYFTMASENNIISGNTVTENTVDGIHLSGPHNTDITGNIIANNNETGINFFDSKNNKVVGNTITGNNGYGIKFWYDSSENTISENHIANNGIGILIDDSFDNNISGNMVTENNGWGIRLEGSQNNNLIYNNNFVNNKVEEGLQVSIPGEWTMDGMKTGGGNVWDNGTVGNYWSDYLVRYPNAAEIDSSGVGNTPYYINENNIDRYPLMEATTIPEFPSWTAMLIIFTVFAVAVALYKGRLAKNPIHRF